MSAGEENFFSCQILVPPWKSSLSMHEGCLELFLQREEVDFFFAVILFFSKGLVFFFAFLKEQNSRAKN
jgi:hypothetical protein